MDVSRNVSATDFIRVVITAVCQRQQQQQQQQQQYFSDNKIHQKLKFLLPSSTALVENTVSLSSTPPSIQPTRPHQSGSNSTTTTTTANQHKIDATTSSQPGVTIQPHQPHKKSCTSKQRAYHNALERQRRHLIATSFNQLKNALPNSTLETVQQEKASRYLIINKACDHICSVQANNLKTRHEISVLAEQNSALEELILQLEASLQKNTVTAE